MVRQARGKGKIPVIPAAVGIGLGAAWILTILGAVVMTFALAGETISIDSMGFGIVVILFVSTFAASMVATWYAKGKKMQISLITAGVYFLTLLAMNAIFFGGEYRGVGVYLLVVILSGAVAAFVGMGGGKSRKHKIKFRANG